MRRLIPVALAASVLLAGCSGGDDPKPKVAPSDSSSAASTTAPPPSPSPTGPVEPTLPPEAEGEDAAAAEAFVRFYWDMVNYAEQTGDIDRLSTLALDSCAACEGGAADIERIYTSGGTVTGGEVDVLSTKSTPFQSGPSAGFAVVVDVRISPQSISEPGKKEQHFDGGPNQFRFIVQREENAWVVGRWDPTT